MHRRNHGFTIVEIAVVVAAIGLIMSIVLVAFNTTQQRARDSKRESDITALSELLETYYEKNGEYPTDSHINYYIQQGSLNANHYASSAVIGTDTTLAGLRTIFGSTIDDSFGDPTRTSPNYILGNVWLNYKGVDHRYYYFGGSVTAYSGNYGSPMMFTGKSGAFRCDYNVVTPAGGTPSSTSYLLGYYQEATDKWIFYQGKQGLRVNVNDNYDATCFDHVIIRKK